MCERVLPSRQRMSTLQRMRDAASRGTQSPRRPAKRLKHRVSATLCFRALVRGAPLHGKCQQWQSYRWPCRRRALGIGYVFRKKKSPLHPGFLHPCLHAPDDSNVVLKCSLRCHRCRLRVLRFRVVFHPLPDAGENLASNSSVGNVRQSSTSDFLIFSVSRMPSSSVPFGTIEVGV